MMEERDDLRKQDPASTRLSTVNGEITKATSDHKTRQWREFVESMLLLLFAMIRSVVKSFKVPDVEVAAARMSNESALTRMTDSTPKKPWSDLTLVLDG